MATLYFKVASDWEEVVRLRKECDKLEAQLLKMDKTKAPAAVAALETQLASTRQQMTGMAVEAAKAGAVMENDFKKKIFDASQSVNGFTEKIIAQKAVVKDIEADVKRLGEAYRTALKRNPLSSNGKLSEYTSAKKALDEEKAALFGLTQEQANARLSVKKLRDEYALFRDDSKETVSATDGIGFSLKKAFAVIGGAALGKEFLSNIIRVKGEFQAADTAIQTLLGSKEKADALMSQVKDFAKISPLEFSDVTAATQMMLGFNIEAEKVPRYLQAIGDVSMGDTQKFNSLTLAFSQMSAAGKLMGQDLNQMINAGFNPLQQISEKTGKSFSVLKDEMSKGAISAEMVQQVFVDATSAGGKFYQMSENASRTINGQISMMHDAIDAALNELGTKSEGVIMSGIQMTTKLVENYETIGKVLAGLIATYGAYRTAVMLTTIATGKHTIAEVALINVRVLARKAQMALNASMLTNPYVALATVVIGLGTAMWAMSDGTSAAERAQKEYNDTKDAASKKEQEHKQKIEELLTSARDESLATLTRQKSLEELRKEYPKIFAQYDIEKLKLVDILKLKQQINEEDSKRSVQGRKDSYNSLKETIDKQKRYLSLIDNPKLQKSMSDEDKEMLRMYGGSKSYYRIKKELEDNSELLKNYQKDVLNDNIASYKANLKNYSKEKLEAELKMAQSSASKRNGFNVGGMMVRGGGLDDIISSINGALSEKKNPTTYKDDYEKAKKDWEDAKKALSEIEKDKSKFTSKQYEEAKKLSETTEKKYKDLGGIIGSSLTKQESASEKLRKETEKYNVLLSKQALEQQRSAEDLQMQADEARIKAMDEGSKKTIAQMELNFEKEMQAIDRQEEDLLRKKIEDARSAWETNPENKKKSFDASGIELSDSELKYFDELYKAAIANNEKTYSDLTNQYLSYTDQRLEIEKRFNDDIAVLQEARKKAVEKGDTDEVSKIDRSVQKRTETKNEDVFKLDADQFKKNMNWEQVFGNLDKVSTDTLKKLKENLKEFISIQKDLSPESLKELIDAMERIDENVSERNPFEAMTASFGSLKLATDAERKAQEAYNKALKEGTDEEKKNAKATLESAKNNKQKALSEATTALHKGVDEIGKYVDAGNQVIGIMETLGLNTPKWLEGAMSGFGEMLNGLGSIDLMKPMSIVTGSLQTIKGALTSITSLGGVINWSGSNAKEVQDSINQLTDRNEALQTSIEDLTDVMEASKGTKSVAAYTDAKKLQKETEDNYKKIAQEQARYSSAHHSWNYYWGGFNQEETSRLSSQIGRNWNGDIWSLSPDEMKMLRSNVDMWEKIQNAGKGGYGERLTDKLNDYIDQSGKMEELTNKLYEGLTAISFDSMYDSFVENLMDMKYDAKSAAEDISEYFMRAMLSNKIGELYSDKLEDWWKKFGASMEDNELTESEREALQEEYMKYIEEAMKLRDELASATGYDKISQESTSQSSTSKGFEAMSQDTGEELNGRFTALQIAGEEIRNQSIAQTQSLNLITMKSEDILRVNSEIRNIADETRDLIANSYLELVQISENTGAIIKPIQQMQKDMAEVKKNTSKL